MIAIVVWLVPVLLSLIVCVREHGEDERFVGDKLIYRS